MQADTVMHRQLFDPIATLIAVSATDMPTNGALFDLRRWGPRPGHS